jgi:hypothetical protein
MSEEHRGEYWVHEDGSFGGYLTPEEIAEKYRQLAQDAWLAQFDADPADAIKPREGEDVVGWIMRTRGLSFPDAVLHANELLEDMGGA